MTIENIPTDEETYKAAKVLIRAIFGAFLASSMSACTTNFRPDSEHGRILISADAEGMRAFSDMQQGLITNGKSSPDVDTPFYSTRREQIRARAMSYSGISSQKSRTRGEK